MLEESLNSNRPAVLTLVRRHSTYTDVCRYTDLPKRGTIPGVSKRGQGSLYSVSETARSCLTVHEFTDGGRRMRRIIQEIRHVCSAYRILA